MKSRACLFLISIVLLLTACSRQPSLTHEEKVFLHYIESMGIPIPNEPHTFILVPNEACKGCKTLSLLCATLDDSDTVTFFTTSKLKEEKQLPDRISIVIDTANIIGNLNWKYRNITEVHTNDGKIEWMRCYEADEVIERFRWVIDAVDTLDFRELTIC